MITLNNCKLFELHKCIYESEPDIIVLNETWLKSSILNNEIIPNNLYKVFRCDRSNYTHPKDPLNPNEFRKKGCGILVAVKSSLLLKFTTNKVNLKCNAEFLAIELVLENKNKIIVATCYRVGTLGIDNCREVAKAINILLRKKRVKKFFLIGDFYLSNADWSNNYSSNGTEQAFIEEFIRAGLIQLINQPTHFRGNTLDILLTNSENTIDNLAILHTSGICKSDHYTISLDIKIKIKRIKPTKIKVFNFKRADWEHLNEDLNNVVWSSGIDSQDSNTAWINFKTTLTRLMNVHIPKITIKTRDKPPCFDAECFEKCREKERLHQKFKRTKSMNDEIKFSACRREYKSLMRKKIRDNLYCTEDSDTITKKFWSHVKNTSKNSRIPEIVHYKTSISSKAGVKATMFNNFFCEQFSLPSTYDIHIDYSSQDDFEIDFSSTRIQQLMNYINVNKSGGPDQIPGIVLKKCAPSISIPLSNLFSNIYYSGNVPLEWKQANVVPIHKKGDKSDISNYKPISLTSLVAKIMERIIEDGLLLRTRHLLSDTQHGFVKDKSCTTNILTLSDNISTLLHNNIIGCDIIYFNFQKAFDTVRHDLILKKLKYRFNIDGTLLRFIKDYLKDRAQRVLLDNSFSDFKPVVSGVPQGSILGPLLFVLFIDDISLGLDPNTHINLYADDTKIWRAMYSEYDCHMLQEDIKKLYIWCNINDMKFHPDKCKVLSINGNSVLNNLLHMLPFSKYSYSIGNNIIDYTPDQKDLGVIINENFTWDDHQDMLLNKASQMLGLTKRTCHFVTSPNSKRTLYLTLVRSLFEHVSITWRPVTLTRIHLFERLQKNSMKWILNEQFLSYADEETYTGKCKQLNILPMYRRFELNDLVFFHKKVHEHLPFKMPHYIIRYNGSSRLRDNRLDSLSYIFNTTYINSNPRSALYKGFFYRTLYAWNKLDFDTRNTFDKNLF